jgi:hypothetical protein
MTVEQCSRVFLASCKQLRFESRVIGGIADCESTHYQRRGGFAEHRLHRAAMDERVPVELSLA